MSMGTEVSSAGQVSGAGRPTGRANRNFTGTAGRRGKDRPRPLPPAGGMPSPPVASGNVGPGGGIPVNPAPSLPGVTSGPQPVPTTGGPQTGTGTPADILSYYQAPLPPIVTAYMQNLQKGGFINNPSFQDLYGTYRATAEKETARRSAALNESFGSQGGRYGSDLLGAQSRLQENLGVDLGQQSAQFLMGLEQQQFNEVSGLGNLQYGASEAGMARMWEDFLRRTSPPPGLSSLYGLSQGYGLPATVIG